MERTVVSLYSSVINPFVEIEKGLAVVLNNSLSKSNRATHWTLLEFSVTTTMVVRLFDILLLD